MDERTIPIFSEIAFVNSTAAMESSPMDINGAFVGTCVPRASPSPRHNAVVRLATSIFPSAVPSPGTKISEFGVV